MKNINFRISTYILLLAFIGTFAVTAFTQTTAFTYQGKLTDTNAPQPANVDICKEVK